MTRRPRSLSRSGWQRRRRPEHRGRDDQPAGRRRGVPRRANNGASKISFANLDGSGGGDLNTTGTTVTAPNGVAIDHVRQGRSDRGSYTDNKVSFANLDNTGGGGDIDTTGATVNGPAFPAAFGPEWRGRALDHGRLDARLRADLFTGAVVIRPARGVPVPGAGRLRLPMERGRLRHRRATSATYTPGPDGSYGCRVTASNQAGSASQTSAAFAVTTPLRPSHRRRRASRGRDP